MALLEVMQECEHEPVPIPFMANSANEPRCRKCGARYKVAPEVRVAIEVNSDYDVRTGSTEEPPNKEKTK